MSHGRSSWKHPVVHVHPSSHASVALSAGATGLELTRACISSHLFLSTLCRACRIVLLDCTLIIALEREYSQCVVCVQSRYFFSSPLFFSMNFGPLGYMRDRIVVYLSLYATPEKIMFTCFLAELWNQCQLLSWRQVWPVWSATAAATKQNSSIKKSHDLIWFCLQILSSQRNTFRHRRHSAVILNSFVFTNWRHPRCDLQHNFTAKCQHLHSLQGGLPNELRHVFQVGSQ